MKEKIVFITGATSGIGKVTATELAKKGAHVIIHGRNAEKANRVREEIVKVCGHQNVDVITGDLASLDDVRKIAGQINASYEKLDVLVNNAGGIMDAKRQVTEDGLERTFAVNVASLFLLSALLFDKIRKSDDGRIIHLSSEAHRFGRPDLDDLQLKKKYSSSRAYGNAKLLVILLTEEMTHRLREAGIQNVTVNALHPGVVATNFARESKGSLMNFFFSVFKIFFISPEKGAQTTIYLASSEKVKNVSGKYFAKSKPARVRRKYITPENLQGLWEACETITEKEFLRSDEGQRSEISVGLRA